MFLAKKGQGMLQSEPAPGHGVRVVNLSSVGENFLQGFEENIHRLPRCVFNMPMHRNDYGLLLCQLHCFTFIRSPCGFNGGFGICSPDFICPWVWLAPMALVGSLFSTALTRVT